MWFIFIYIIFRKMTTYLNWLDNKALKLQGSPYSVYRKTQSHWWILAGKEFLKIPKTQCNEQLYLSEGEKRYLLDSGVKSLVIGFGKRGHQDSSRIYVRLG